jgi:hypothetical protein
MPQLFILFATLCLLALADLEGTSFCKSETCEGQGQLQSIKSEELNKCTFKKSPCSNVGAYVIIKNNQTHAIHTVYKDDKCTQMHNELVWVCGKCTPTPFIAEGSSLKLTCDSGNVEIQQGVINTGLGGGLTTSGFVSNPASTSFSVANPVYLPPITQPLSTATTTTFPATTTTNVLPTTTSILPTTTTTVPMMTQGVPVMTQPAAVLPATVLPAQQGFQQGGQQGGQQPAGWNGQQAGFATGQNNNPGYQYATGPQPNQGPQGQGTGYRSGWQYNAAGSLFVNPFTFIIGLLAYAFLI